MELTDYGKKILGACTPKSSLEHTDPSLECTKDIPNQYVRDIGGNAGDVFEFEPDEKALASINNLLSDHFNLKLPGSL